MKWIALLFIIMAAPALAAWLRTNPRRAPWIWSLLTFLPFVLGPWHLMVAPYATPFWSGYVKGWEVSLLDSVAIGVLFGSRGRLPGPLLVIPFIGYILAAAFAVSQARFGALAWSYPIQLCRVFLVFLAVAKVVRLEEGERAVLRGLILGICVQAGYAFWARAGGALQTGGSLGHQNLLGFVSHMALMPAFAVFLGGRWPRLALFGVIGGLTVVILTASRATIALSGLGLILTLIISMAVRFSGRKAVVGLAGVALLLVAFPLAQASLDRRFAAKQGSFFQEDREREAFERAALAMLAVKPMGVGPNHYVFIANTEGYSAKAGVTWAEGSRSTNVHNSYLLIAAESGYLGLLTFAMLIGCSIVGAFATAVRYRREAGSDTLIGVGCGIVATALHGNYEWMFVIYPTQYLFAASLGIIAGLRSRYRAAKARPVASRPPLREQRPATALLGT